MAFINKFNLIGGAITALLTAILGKYWFLFAGLLVFNIIDWLTGWYYARLQHIETSKAGAKGIVKKIGYWIVIGIAFYISFAFKGLGDVIGIDLSFTIGIGWFALAGYLVNEIRSILENAVKLGWKIPDFLIKGLLAADKKISGKINNKEADEDADNR